MRKLLYLILLIPFVSFGQGNVTQQNPVQSSGPNYNKQVFVYSNVAVNNTFSIPSGTSATWNNATFRIGALFYRTADSALLIGQADGTFVALKGGGSGSAFYLSGNYFQNTGVSPATAVTWASTIKLTQNTYIQNQSHTFRVDTMMSISGASSTTTNPFAFNATTTGYLSALSPNHFFIDYTDTTHKGVDVRIDNTWADWQGLPWNVHPKVTFQTAPNLTGSSTTGYVWTATDNAGNGAWSPNNGLPAGSNMQVQYNNSGAFGASSTFTWNNAATRLVIGSVDPSMVNVGSPNLSVVNKMALVSDATTTPNIFFWQSQNSGGNFSLRLNSSSSGGGSEILTAGVNGGVRVGISALDPSFRGLEADGQDSLATHTAFWVQNWNPGRGVFGSIFKVQNDASILIPNMIASSNPTTDSLVARHNGQLVRVAASAVGGGTTANPVTFNNSGSGGASGSTFNGASALTVSYNTLGAVPTTTTVAGFPLSSNVTLASHVAAYGLSGSAYNGSTTQTWTADTASSTGLVSKGRLATNLLGYAKSITLNTPNVVFSTPVTFSNTSSAFSGTLSLNTQTANTVFAGAASGGATTPTFRALVAADLPSGTPVLSGTGFVYSTGSTVSYKTPVSGEVPTGSVNGTNTIFTAAHTPLSGTFSIYYDGVMLRPTTDYTISGTTITTTFAPSNTSGSGSILINYEY